eukprot:gene24872-biopygen21443
METGDLRLKRRCGKPLVRSRGTRPQLRIADALDLAEALGGKAHDKTGGATIAHQKVGTDADDKDRIFFGNGLQEGCEIFLVGRLEHDFRRAAGAEPGHLFHAHIGRQPPAQPRETIPQLAKQGLAVNP